MKVVLTLHPLSACLLHRANPFRLRLTGRPIRIVPRFCRTLRPPADRPRLTTQARKFAHHIHRVPQQQLVLLLRLVLRRLQSFGTR